MRIIATDKGQKAIYLAIAELLGHKGGTPKDKVKYGKKCHTNRKLHNLILEERVLTDEVKEELLKANPLLTTDETYVIEERNRAENARGELHENIWLERLYDELDQYAISKITGKIFAWSVPIELDASASMLSYIGLLLGEKRLLEMTNSSFTGTLNDPWKVNDKLPRKMTKSVIMKKVYGSSRSEAELLKDDNIDFTVEQLALLREELQTGAYGVANDFKEFIIRNVKPTENMTPCVYEDTFEVKCNRYRNVGEYVVPYDIFDSQSKLIKRIKHVHTSKVADLEQFRKYWVTGLVHSLDSQVLNYVMEKVMEKYGWGIDIHDAILVSPEAAEDVRNWYAEELQVIYDNRKAILTNFFNSIGIRSSEAMNEWDKLMSKVVPVENFKASGWTLK